MPWINISPGHEGFSVKEKIVADVERDDNDVESPWVVKIMGKPIGRAKTNGDGKNIVEYQLINLCKNILDEVAKSQNISKPKLKSV